MSSSHAYLVPVQSVLRQLFMISLYTLLLNDFIIFSDSKYQLCEQMIRNAAQYLVYGLLMFVYFLCLTDLATEISTGIEKLVTYIVSLFGIVLWYSRSLR